MAKSNLSISPHPSALIESLRNIGYTANTALADIIDNSVTANASHISVQFRWSETDSWIAIIDNGRGMSEVELTNAMRLGSSSPLEERNKNDLGRFGLGMKTASISQCRHLSVISKKENEIQCREWNLDEISASNSDDWLLSKIDSEEINKDQTISHLINQHLSHSTSGTIVLWRNLDVSLIGEIRNHTENRFNEILNSAKTHLEMVFHRYIAPGPGLKALKIDFNGSALIAFDPFGPDVNSRQERPSEEIVIDQETIRVQPYILPHHSKVSRADYNKYAGSAGYLANQGFYIYRNKRLIVKATWFRLIKKEELNKLIRIRVDIPNSLDHLWNININKSQVRPPETVRRELRKIIKRIEGTGKMVFTRRATKLVNRKLTPVWKREAMNGKVHYKVNDEHPLLLHLLKNIPVEHSKQLKSCLNLINQSFPFDSYYADVACDEVELNLIENDTEKTRSMCAHIIEALRCCGFETEDIRKKVLKTEIPGATEAIINEILETL